ncbi:MAG: hypothetical protein K2N14_02565 [Clostridia bacterium]|nr:hypothetical protein [Clostridia bacterium]
MIECAYAMAGKTMKSEDVLNYISEYLIMALDELTEEKSNDGFVEGEITAYVECLEILNFWNGFKRFGITDIEKKYQIR